jgi:methionyl aminopeptidase
MAPQLTGEELLAYEKAGEVVKALKLSVASLVRADTKLLELAGFVEAEILRKGAMLAFPCNISINEIASHHTPARDSQEVFKRGDVVKIDLGAIVDGYIADTAFTVEVETNRQRGLIESAKKALDNAIEIIHPGISIAEIGREITRSASADGFNVLRDLYGHNMDKNCLHGGLTIPSFDNGSTRKIREGDVLAIEPFLTGGSGEISRNPGGNIFQVIRRDAVYAVGAREKVLLEKLNREYCGFPFTDRWLGADSEVLPGLLRTAAVKEYPMLVEKDGAPVAQTEHTLIVLQDGNKIIT